MELTTIDFIIVGLILFLGIKGIVTGFTHELLNFIGLVGGVALASRVNVDVGNFVNINIYPINSEPALELTGFIATLIIVWIVFSFTSSVVNKFTLDSKNIFDRLLGYLITVARYIAIFSILIIGVEKSEFLSQKLSKHYENSQLFPIFIEIGNSILNRDENRSHSVTKGLNGITTTKSQDINLSAI